jgi:amino acid adenylation domain-containing protein
MRHSTFVNVLRRRAEQQPERLAYRFLHEDGHEETWTYAELYRRVGAIAGALRDRHVAGAPVLLLFPAGLAFVGAFLGALAAGAVAVPAPAPRSRRSLVRLQALALDACPTLILTTDDIGTRLSQPGEGLTDVAWLATETLSGELREWPHVSEEQIAFLQYTSGSTDVPKGVIVTHRNLMENSRLMERAFGYTADSHCFTWLPPSHDMGLIGGILQPLHGGFPSTMMAPASFLQAPLRWLHGITRYRATISGGPNFAYELCARRLDPAQASTLDLRSWTVAFNGSEPVRAETLERFSDRYRACGFDRRAFMSCYGLAEATLFVAGHRGEPTIAAFDAEALGRNEIVRLEGEPGPARARRVVGVGAPEDRAVVVDPVTHQPKAHGVGEIWIRGESCARGYWNRPDATAQTFEADIDGQSGTYLRTGDLGCISGGELFITGRLKELIIARGVNHYAHDIELSVERADPRLRPGCGAAFGIDVDDQERLVVIQEVDRTVHDEDLGGAIAVVRRRVAEEHDLAPYAVVLVAPGDVPKTSSGKIQRGVCRERYARRTLCVKAEWCEATDAADAAADAASATRAWTVDDFDARLAMLVATHTGLQRSEIDGSARVSSLGLDSLQATTLLHAIEAQTGVAIGLSRFFDNPTLAELADAIRDGLRASGPPVARDEADETEYPLTWGQQSLLALHRLAIESHGPDINIAVAFRIRGRLDRHAFQRCWHRMTRRHPALRSVFFDRADGAVQRVRRDVAVPVIDVDAFAWSMDELSSRMVLEGYRPFDLRRDCPLRIALFRRGEDEHVVVVALNHIAGDFWSLALLFSELHRLYTAEREGTPIDLSPPAGRFSRYVRGEQQLLADPEATRLRDYWCRRLGTNLPALDFTTDGPRPRIRTFWGRREAFAIDPALAARLRQLAREHDATLYMVLLAALQGLLSRYTGQDTIAINSPAMGRPSVEFADVVGYFANPLILRGDLTGDPTYRQLLADTRRTVVDALAHQAYPFPLVSRLLQPEPDLSRPPLAQAMFLLHHAVDRNHADVARFALGTDGGSAPLADLTIEPIALNRCFVQFDLGLVMAESGHGLEGAVEYNTDLFERGTVRRFIEAFIATLEAIAARPDTAVSRWPLVPPSRRHVVVHEWNDTRTRFAVPNGLHELIEQQVERTPDATAVTFGDRLLTYRQLNNQANRWAARLRQSGVDVESVVAVSMPRSLELVVALLGILKAGGAYVPIEPDAPVDRARAVLQDCGAPVVLTTAAIAASGAFEQARALEAAPEADDRDEANLQVRTEREQLAYVIYTSGSTGRPKGVMNTHGGIVNRLCWMQQAFRLDGADRVLQKTPVTFDVSVWEFFWPLISGAHLVIARPGAHRDPAALVRQIADDRITTVHFVPSMLDAFLDRPGLDRCSALRRVICSGEALSFDLQERCAARLPAELHNLYGPTEAAIDVTWWACTDSTSRRVPIGRPIANTEVYVLDANLEPVPPGVTGMLYLGGAGIARGYLRQSSLTANAFVPDLFSNRPGDRLFRTGDLGRYRPDGVIEYIGRIDHQVKIGGARVEPAEIEAVLARHALIGTAAVVARALHGETQLVAYVVTADGTVLPADELRAWLSGRLPQYMIPSHFVFLDRLPVTASGKLDRRALPEPDRVRPAVDTPLVPPRTPLEARLAALWAELLDRRDVGVDDNFFDLGGHSLVLMQLASRIRDEFGVDVPIPVLFDVPTVAGMAVAIVSQQLEECPNEAAARLLAEIEAAPLHHEAVADPETVVVDRP